ncbi:HNH endonuclease [Bathymodiolus thermophilus thioautotrophic gill symbiont]|uniref:HNH endonuclease n=1 Tax=Bathymodiolus thermophilus thioautotrophic gill symbiont TaxID=2360 RepID=UPI0008FAF896|nr:HNH endonuclease [Bathymodiolus thermophilus thioautotrophic gill symbiont]
MVQNEYEYIEFLVKNGLQKDSADSYVRYLEAVSRALNITINDSAISSKKDVDIIIEKLSKTDLAENYKNNCGTALRKYLKFITETNFIYRSPDEIENPNQYTEGSKKVITVNSYERDNKARNKCIEIHGLGCAVCNMNFENIYGSIGIGFIHVHHIKPLSEINKNYLVSPEKDLIPVCPNCHAMLHRKKNAISIDSLKEMYNENKA